MTLNSMAVLMLLAIGWPVQAQTTSTTHAVPPASSYRIAGVVVDSLTGQPIIEASVAIGPTANVNGDISRKVVTGADGRFAFTGLARGKYSLMGSAHGFGAQYFEQHGNYSSAIAVGPDLDSEHLVFRLQQDASIEGQVTDDNNDPVQSAQVRLFMKRGFAGAEEGVFPVTQAETDDRGHFHIGHLTPQTYHLVVAARPWYADNQRPPGRKKQGNSDGDERSAQEMAALDVTYPLTFYPDSQDSAGASPIVLRAGEHATADVVMHAVPALHLRIRTGVASFPAGAMVAGTVAFARGGMYPRILRRIFDGYLDHVFNSPVSQTESGVIEIMGLAPGHYIVEIPPSNTPNERGVNRGWYQEIDLAGDAELSAGDASGFATVSGSILFEGANSVPKGTSILLSNPTTGGNFSAPISESGQFDFSSSTVRPGRYNMLLGGSGRFFFSRLSATGAKLVGRTLEIEGAGHVRIAAVASRGLGQVEGVALRDGQPFAGAMVVLVPRDPANNAPLFRRDQSDSDGTFTLPTVVPGSYTVVTIANGWNLEWSNPAVLQPYLKGGGEVQVPSEGHLEIKVNAQ